MATTDGVCHVAVEDPSVNTDAQPCAESSDREATELHNYNELRRQASGPSAGDDSHISGPVTERVVWKRLNSVRIFWGHQIAATAAHESCRDHFALERTFLAYLRTSLALTMLGVLIAQLFRLQHTEDPDLVLGFFILGIPLACTCVAAAIVVILLGGFRFWRQQNAILRGKINARGWELVIVLILVFLALLSMFILVVFADVRRSR